jgi:phage terminase small subunit
LALNPKQRAFVAAYSGNATEAARAAGYSEKTAYQQGHALLKHPEIIEAIRGRENKELRPLIATRAERQAFWSGVMRDEDHDMGARLKASELLGKSEADFTDKIAGAEGGPLEIIVKTVASE